MKIIAPSMLASDFLNIETEINLLKDIDNLWIHLDIMDGHFVPNLTFGHPIIKQISKITKIPLDAHLMVTNPLFHGELMKDCDLYNFTFHLESVLDQDIELIVDKLKKYYKSVGISIKPNTKFDQIPESILKKIDLLLIMTVEPGFGGQSFMNNMIEKIKQARIKRDSLNLKYVIQVDGGINEETSKQVIKAGADNLVAGSYVFKEQNKNYKKQINSLRNL